MAKPRRMQERRGRAFTLAVGIVKPTLLALTRRDWSGGMELPAHGGAVLAVNHVSHLDPLTTAHFVYDHGRLPRYLAKAELFDVPVLGAFMRGAGQIPVHRLSGEASKAFASAVEAVRRGEIVIVYPEGTITRDPELWPMVGRTGAARIALTADVPVIPVAQWGAQDILYPYDTKPHLFPRHRIQVHAGPPVDLDDLRRSDVTPELLHEATDRIMGAITRLLEEVRGERAPEQRFDPKAAGVRAIGNPRADRRRERRRSR